MGTPTLKANGIGAFVRVRRFPTRLLTACGCWLLGLGLYFIALRPSLLPEDLRFIGTTADQIQEHAPGLARWLKRVFIVTGGFMADAGVLTLFIALSAMPSRLKGTSPTLALSGLLTVGLMSASNFALDSDFRWLLLIPAVAWLVGFAGYVLNRNQPVTQLGANNGL